MPKVWKVSPRHSQHLIKQLLWKRGIKTADEAEKFFHPKLEEYERDLEIAGIKSAKKRILKAIEKKELIIVYGDYDADGICATAIFYHALAFLGAQVLPYIPHREKEGYGLSKVGLKDVKEKGATLIITADNGIVALEQANFAKSLGLDLIITDHHLPLKEKPKATAIVHSTKLCGAGVAWCLVRQMVKREFSEKLLDLVALATVGDMIPLLGVNRALVKEGLKKLNQAPRVGLQALTTEAGLASGSLKAYHLSHILIPRLNAKGRLENAMDALRLLCTKDTGKAMKLAKVLGETNDQRKQLVAEAVIQAKSMIDGTMKKIIILESENWIPGIVGLVAGKICEEYKIPTVVISRKEMFSKGSARSVTGVNIVETIRQFSHLLIDVGGHPQAAGFTIETSRIPAFKTNLEEVMEKCETDPSEQVEIEAVVERSNLTYETAQKIEALEPTGVGNPKPLLMGRRMKVSAIRTVGQGQHLKFQADNLEAIAFSLGYMASSLKTDQEVDMVFYLEIDKFNGSQKLQLKVLDIQY